MLKNLNYQQSKRVQCMGVGVTSIIADKTYTIPAETFSGQLKVRDVLAGNEVIFRNNCYEYVKFGGIQVLAFPSMDKSRLYVNLQWQDEFVLDNIYYDDSTKLFTWPHLRNQSFYFLPPNIALKNIITSDQFRINFRQEWLTTEDFNRIITQESFPCALYFQKVGQVEMSLKISVKLFYRRSTTDDPDTKGICSYPTIKPDRLAPSYEKELVMKQSLLILKKDSGDNVSITNGEKSSKEL